MCKGLHKCSKMRNVIANKISTAYVYKHKQMEAKEMHQNNEHEFELTALSAEEQKIIRALRDPATARELYDLMHISNILSKENILEI